ncbi:MAG: NUDIX domain-containing protein [Steroidobacteraceae bacterium]
MAAGGPPSGTGEATVQHVVAAVMFDRGGRVLVTQRPAGKHMAGKWEFPGGKLEPGESRYQGLVRECREELDVDIDEAEPLISVRHSYPDREVLLDAWMVRSYRGLPRGLDGQRLSWVEPDELSRIDLLEADAPIVTAIRLPRLARVLPGGAGLALATRLPEPELLVWRPLDDDPDTGELRARVTAARAHGHRVVVAGDVVQAAMMAVAMGADGVLLDPGSGPVSIDPADAALVGVACEDAEAAMQAVNSGAHFVVLRHFGPVSRTRLAPLLAGLRVPVLLGWFADTDPLEAVREAGAHGCAVDPRLAGVRPR